jgi:hypothetical protein
MRARLESIRRSGKWVEALALTAGAVVVVVAVAALRDSGPSQSHGPSRGPRTGHRSVPAFARSPGGVAEAAVTYMDLLGEAAVGGSVRANATLSAMTVGSLGTQLERGLPTLARALHARLASTGAAAAFEGWPLGYRVTAFSATSATVLLWHLDLAASSALGLMTTDYVTTTYRVRWLGGTWRIEGASEVSGPTPPAPNASTLAVDRFARAAREFSGYRHVP